MRVINEMGLKQYQFSAKSIDNDYKAGFITREQAYKQHRKLKESYQKGLVNKRIAEGVNGSKTMVMK